MRATAEITRASLFCDVKQCNQKKKKTQVQFNFKACVLCSIAVCNYIDFFSLFLLVLVGHYLQSELGHWRHHCRSGAVLPLRHVREVNVKEQEIRGREALLIYGSCRRSSSVAARSWPPSVLYYKDGRNVNTACPRVWGSVMISWQGFPLSPDSDSCSALFSSHTHTHFSYFNYKSILLARLTAPYLRLGSNEVT